MKNLGVLSLIIFFSTMLSSCKTGSAPDEEQQAPVVSVKADHISIGTISTEVSFNGNTVYLRKNQVVSPITGYVTKVNVRFGEEVRKNEVLFEIRTIESQALDADSTAHNFGVIKVNASSEGFVDDIAVNESGAYIPEGGQLCSIVNNRDLMMKVNIPFEYNSLVQKERKCSIILADNSVLTGSVIRFLPVMDEANQTQTVLIRPETSRQLPENMNVIIKFPGESHRHALLISKSALMTNETQGEFWIMKIDSGNLAVKVPVVKGISNDSIVEILSDRLQVNDRVITDGAYGLSDSSVVKIAE